MIFALDFETVPFEPGLMAPPPVCLSWADESSAHLVDRDGAEEAIESLLSGSAPVSIANAAFDMAVACAWYPRLIPLVFDAYDRTIVKDVLIRQKLIDLALGKYLHHGKYHLAGLVKRLSDIDLDKRLRVDFGQLAGIPIEYWPEEYREYALDDSRWHRDIYLMQQEGLAEEGRLEVLDDENRQCRAAFALQLASVWGLRTDVEGVAALKAKCEERTDQLRPLLLGSGLLAWKKAKGERVLGRKTRIAQARMLELRGWGDVKLTKTGRKMRKAHEDWQQVKYVSVDAEACADSGDDLLLGYSEYTQLNSLLTGHVPAVEKGIAMPIHTRFDELKETGRTGSSKPNIQNVRRAPGARECFIPRPGWVYVGCDFDKAELHTLAQCCVDIFGSSPLADALNNGYDPHTGLGARLAGITYEEACTRIAADDEETIEWRRRAKPANFGFPGGMGPFGMMAYAKAQYGVHMTIEESEELHGGWQMQWPRVSRDYLNWIRNLCGATGYANIKHFQSNRWRSHIPYCVAANSFFQGRAADGAKAALYEVSKRCYSEPGSPLFGCRPVNFVHDEIIMEAPLEQASDAAWEMRDVMVSAFNRFVPDVPVKATPALMDRWSKKAKTIVDSEGRLQVWRYGK
jgi:hypothetical protein